MTVNAYNKMPFTINAVTCLFCTHFQNPLNGMNKNDACEMMASVNLGKMFFSLVWAGLTKGVLARPAQTGKKTIYSICLTPSSPNHHFCYCHSKDFEIE